MIKIGVFDSGIGGLSVANAIKKAIEGVEVVYVSDQEHLPYGTKSPEELRRLVEPKMRELIEKGVDVIVIACNTVSTTILDYVKEIVPVPVIGVEPMVEAASKITKSNIIAVCATPTTLSSKRYLELKDQYAKEILVLEPDCSRWTKMIEDNQLDRSEIFEIIDGVCSRGADVIVLGCTHYHWIEELVINIADGRAKVIQPEGTVIARLKDFLGAN